MNKLIQDLSTHRDKIYERKLVQMKTVESWPTPAICDWTGESQIPSYLIDISGNTL